MASLLELVDSVNKGQTVDPAQLELYQQSANSAEQFLAHHAQAVIELRKAQQHLLQSLEAIDYSDQKVLNQFITIGAFLGMNDQRCGPMVRFGATAIARREHAIALDAIQNAVTFDISNRGSFVSDRENCLLVASQYQRIAQAVSWRGPRNLQWNNRQMKIALVVSGIADDESCGRMIRGLARHHDAKRLRLHVYSTEASVRRERQIFAPSPSLTPSARRGARTIDMLSRQKLPLWIAPIEADLMQSARELANQLVKDRIDVAIIDATIADPIAAIIAQWETSAVKVNLCRTIPLYASGIDCVTYVDPARYENDQDFWQRRGTETRFVLEGIDIDESAGKTPQRSACGIPEHAIVLATVSEDLDRTIGEDFADMIVAILRANPSAIFLAIGPGELAWQKRKFDSAGVGKRIGHAGKRRDLPSFIQVADVYLAEFPVSGATGVLQAMAAARPVVAVKWGDDAAQSQAAAIAGNDAAITHRDPGAYLERVNRLVRDAEFRQQTGRLMRSRLEQHFTFAQTARYLEQMCEQLMQQRFELADDAADIQEPPQAMSAVA